MYDRRTQRLTGGLLIAVPLLFTACFTLLQFAFEYPDILRQPEATILSKFQAGGPTLIAMWYAMTLSALLFIPLAVLVERALAPDSTMFKVATAFGIGAGLVQALGFIRWPLLVPWLASSYAEGGAAQRETLALIFGALHRYAGVGIGENLGFLCTAMWTLLVAQALRPSAGRALAWSGTLLALGIAAGTLEPAGWAAAGAINAISYLLWAAWLIWLGVWLLRRTTTRAALAAA